MALSVKLVSAVCLIQVVVCYPTFRDLIPNGHKIPNPCNNSDIWKGVGHWAPGGGGDRNPFGIHFKERGYSWSKDLCQIDSDGDGMSNGEELGDPDCTWFQGSAEILPTTGLSHPGICEPVGSEKCKGKNEPQGEDICKSTTFECDAIHESGVEWIDVQITDSPVPAKETTYMCQTVPLKDDKDYHLIAAEPIIKNINVIHHILVYGCTDEANFTGDPDGPTECFMNRKENCEDLIAIWAVGFGGSCYHKDTGFKVGLNGYKNVIIEVHWNNPMEMSTYRDSSGMRLYLTSNLRPYDAGMLTIGQSTLLIPPRREKYTVNGTCKSKCTKEYLEGPINIVGATNHMHYLGSGALTKMIMPDKSEVHLAVDKKYSYDSPKFYLFDEPYIMEPGYELQISCHYNSSKKDTTTFYGEATSAEMCFAFLMYYPKQNLDNPSCIQNGPISQCEYGQTVNGCDMTFFDPQNPEFLELIGNLYSRCQIGICLEECKDVIRRIKQHPCFTDEFTYVFTSELRNPYGDPTSKLQSMEFWYRIESCSAEIAEEDCQWGSTDRPWSSAAEGISYRLIGLFGALLITILL